MTEGQGNETKGFAAYAASRTRNAESDFVSAKDHTVEPLTVRIVGVGEMDGFNQGERTPFWSVVGSKLTGTKIVRETTPMSRKLLALGVGDPTGYTVVLTTVKMGGNDAFAIVSATPPPAQSTLPTA
jgi:hypothetical protein